MVGRTATPVSASRSRCLLSKSPRSPSPSASSPSPIIFAPSPLIAALDHHPVEVVARIRELPGGALTLSPSSFLPLPDGCTLRLKAGVAGYRDFSLDGISCAHDENLHAFYEKYVSSRVQDVKMGGSCTVMMSGPTGSGKSHTMFGSVQEAGIVYRGLQQILGVSMNGCTRSSNGEGAGAVNQQNSVRVSVLEIYNEEVYNLLDSNSATGAGSWKASPTRARLEVMGGRVKNATSITGSDAEKVAREIATVEKRRVVKNTACNDRSSRSHCIVTVDVPSVGGRLVLVDMAGSENIDQAGLGLQMKWQTGKINQGNVALKRVVEAIANGDSHIPYRDSKLTMLLQDSFEDGNAKILMVLCASPDPKEFHRTMGTLEYGAKAKCIVRLPTSPPKKKDDYTEENVRVNALQIDVKKLRQANQELDSERKEMENRYSSSQQEVQSLTRKFAKLEKRRMVVTQMQRNSASDQQNWTGLPERLEVVVERMLVDCKALSDKFMRDSQRRYEDLVRKQLSEIKVLSTRVEDVEVELLGMHSCTSQAMPAKDDQEEACEDHKSLAQIAMRNYRLHPACNIVAQEGSPGGNAAPPSYASQDREDRHPFRILNDGSSQNPIESAVPYDSPGNACSFQSDRLLMDGQKEGEQQLTPTNLTRNLLTVFSSDQTEHTENTEPVVATHSRSACKFEGWLPVIPEELELDEFDCQADENYICTDVSVEMSSIMTPKMNLPKMDDDEVDHASVNCNLLGSSPEEKDSAKHVSNPADTAAKNNGECDEETDQYCDVCKLNPVIVSEPKVSSEDTRYISSQAGTLVERKEWSFLSRGDQHCELDQPIAAKRSMYAGRRVLNVCKSVCQKSLAMPEGSYSSQRLIFETLARIENGSNLCGVYAKWETKNDSSHDVLKVLTIEKSASLADLRELLMPYIPVIQQDFVFLTLGEAGEAPVKKAMEPALKVTSLPSYNDKKGSRLACLRLPKRKSSLNTERGSHPFRPLENQIGMAGFYSTPRGIVKQKQANRVKESSAGAGGNPGETFQ